MGAPRERTSRAAGLRSRQRARLPGRRAAHVRSARPMRARRPATPGRRPCRRGPAGSAHVGQRRAPAAPASPGYQRSDRARAAARPTGPAMHSTVPSRARRSRPPAPSAGRTVAWTARRARPAGPAPRRSRAGGCTPRPDGVSAPHDRAGAPKVSRLAEPQPRGGAAERTGGQGEQDVGTRAGRGAEPGRTDAAARP